MAQRERSYDASDLKELMDNAGGWARSWDDLLRYLRGPGVYDADLAEDEVPRLIDDIERLKQRGVRFDTDYRKLWEAISGEQAGALKPPEGVKPSPTNPLELQDKYLKGLSFPARRKDVVACAQKNDAPERVLQVLERIEDKEYGNFGSVIEAVGDETWDHD